MNRTFLVYLEDQPGALNRVVSLIRARAYNIESLTTGQTHVAGLHRMTLVVRANADQGRRIEANLYKCVNVLQVADITERQSVCRVLALYKVRTTPETRADIVRIGEEFQARVVDIGEGSLIFEVSGTPEKIESMGERMTPFGILEHVRTGIAAMTRASDPSDDALAFDLTDLFVA